MPKAMNVHSAISKGWRLFKISFTDGSYELIASFISRKARVESRTYLVTNCVLTKRIDDEIDEFSYEEFFGKKLSGLIEDITEKCKSGICCK